MRILWSTRDAGSFRVAAALLAVSALLGGCSTKLPTIAHVHIGHATTGWHDTPDEKGLFVVAEEDAEIAVKEAGEAVASANDLTAVKRHVGNVQNALDPAVGQSEDGTDYGLIKALNGASDHMEFAAESKDASENVKASVADWRQKAKAIVARSELVVALGEEVKATSDSELAAAIAAEILELSEQNLHGKDVDGNGVVGDTSEEYGLTQLRTELEAMIAREDPPYEPVARRYLLGLIRLPSGEWVFSDKVTSGYGGY